jgi:hypothetical protein
MKHILTWSHTIKTDPSVKGPHSDFTFRGRVWGRCWDELSSPPTFPGASEGIPLPPSLPTPKNILKITSLGSCFLAFHSKYFLIKVAICTWPADSRKYFGQVLSNTFSSNLILRVFTPANRPAPSNPLQRKLWHRLVTWHQILGTTWKYVPRVG